MIYVVNDTERLQNIEERLAKLEVSQNLWNRCDECGRFIAINSFYPDGCATRTMVLPDSWYSTETYETLCEEHAHQGVGV